MPKSGHFYYIKLKTRLGVFYKVGFTTMNSVEARFSYDGSMDYNLVDKVLLFEYSENSYLREQRVHQKFYLKKAFPKYSKISHFPLSKNGQSELYYEDILEKDNNYSKELAEQTKLNVNAMKINENILGYIVMFLLFVFLFPFSLIFALFILLFQYPLDKSLPILDAYKLNFKRAISDLSELKFFFKTIWHLIKNYKSIQKMY